MKESKKQLLAEITKIECALNKEEKAIEEHKAYLYKTVQSKDLILYGALFSSFIIGWQGAKTGVAKKGVKKIFQIAAPFIWNTLQNQFLHPNKKP